MSLLAPLHPAVQKWFAGSLGEPTPPQREGWPPIREGRSTLIAAPTGSGKTLAAFLSAIDALIRQGDSLKDETQVLYVSPLRALSNDVQKNLQGPLAQIRALDPSVPEIRVLVRTGDTPPSERAAMSRRPPHILVTTPESLYLLLTSAGGRNILRTVSTVIVDEIHALDPRQARQPPRALPRAPRAPRRATDPARRPLGDAEAARRGGPLPRGRGARVHPRRRRDVPDAGPRDRDPAVASCDGLLARAVGGDLRAHRRARPRAQDDARLREHAQDGRAHRGAAHAPPRGGRGHEPPRQPLEGPPAGCRAAPQGRAGSGRSSRPPRWSSASTSATWTSRSRSARRARSRRSSSASAARATCSAGSRRGGSSRSRSTSSSRGPPSSRRSAAPSSTGRRCPRAPWTSSRSRSSPRPPQRPGTSASSSTSSGRPGRTGTSPARSSTASSRSTRTAAARSCTATA